MMPAPENSNRSSASGIAEFDARRLFRFTTRGAGSDQRIDLLVEMESPFVFHLAFESPSADERR